MPMPAQQPHRSRQAFGKPQLRIATVGQFTRLASGYRYPYAVVPMPAAHEAVA